MAVIPVALGGRRYEVRIGRGLLDDAAAHVAPFMRKARVPVVADANAWAAHGERLSQSLAAAGRELALFQAAPGESAKSWTELARLADFLLAEGVDRADHVLAFGGGVVGDLTGFACAILKRGCGFVQIPTTLLAQVDSSVGGKTAINTAAGKNLIGAFHQPSLVLADLDTLATLPRRELRAGYAEVVKYGVIGNRGFFDWLRDNCAPIMARHEPSLERAIATSVAAKAEIVVADERETTGERALLNFGHTFAHALEAETGYSDRLLHGEAVALGMVLASRYSARRGLIEDDEAGEVMAAIDAAGLPSEIAALTLGCDGAGLVAHMMHDKKKDGAYLPLILLRGIGDAFVARDIDLADVAAFLDEELRAH